MNRPEIVMFGGAVVDIPICPIDPSVFTRNSTPVPRIQMNTGGDALNESMVLAALGDRVKLCSVVGDDAAGDFILRRCREAGIDTGAVTVDPNLDTSVNMVLVDPAGERYFVTSSSSSLRKFDLPHTAGVLADLEGVKIAGFASIFVSPPFVPEKMAELFRQLKAAGVTLCADMTRHKNDEMVADIACCLQYIDYLFPNESEAAAVTGETDPEKMADALLAAGVKNVVIKTGSRGCLLKNHQMCVQVAGYPVETCVDTTGAGDTFAAGFIHGLNLGLSPIECARFANACASVCVERVGADAVVGQGELVRERYAELGVRM